MSVEKRIPSLWKLYSFYKETPEMILDETDVDSYSCHNIFDICQSQPPKVRESKGSYKKSSAFKSFQVCFMKTQQRYILQEEMNISEIQLSSLVHSLRDSKLLIERARLQKF